MLHETLVMTRRPPKRLVRPACGLLGALIVALALTGFAPSAALASHQQVSILEEDAHLFVDPAATLQEERHLGVDMIRIPVRWSWIAPNATSFTKPNFDATNPNAYPAGAWSALDAAVLDAQSMGIRVMFNPTAFAPLWAQGPNASRYGGKYNTTFAWEPSASEFGQFVQAVATRYSGSFVPPGSSTPLPRVSYWEIYNEPNFGEDLAPQAIDGSRVLYAPKLYRAIADDSWAALQTTGHRGDTILIGSLLADGYVAPPSRKYPQGLPGTYGDTMPLSFVRDLYCLQPNNRPLLGYAASLLGCPTTTAGYRNFRSQHPVLFQASGFSDHPYDLPRELPPTRAASNNANWTEFSEIPRFETQLDGIQRVYGSAKQFPVWNTEFGYITCPPNCSWHWVSATTAATYINWAEYLSWRNPRIPNTMQYLLYDPNPQGEPEQGGFSSGLVSFSGVPKAEYNAYRMPIFLPSTATRRGRALEVWGDVRPAPFAVADGDGPQYVQIQFQRRGGGAWTTLKTLRITDPHGYVDTWMTFPATGWVRLQWTYPSSDSALKSTMITNSNGTIYSRTVGVSLR